MAYFLEGLSYYSPSQGKKKAVPDGDCWAIWKAIEESLKDNAPQSFIGA